VLWNLEHYFNTHGKLSEEEKEKTMDEDDDKEFIK
jgi:hypothetical protein